MATSLMAGLISLTQATGCFYPQLSLVANLTSASSPKASANPSFTSSCPRFLSEPELSGSMSSTQGTKQPLGPALCSTTFQRAQCAREANWETLSSLHSAEPTGL